jgi:hypothetical protein
MEEQQEQTITQDDTVTAQEQAKKITFLGSLKNLFVDALDCKKPISVKEFWFSTIWAILLAIISTALLLVGNTACAIAYVVINIVILVAQVSVVCRRFTDNGMRWWAAIPGLALLIIGLMFVTVIQMPETVTMMTTITSDLALEDEYINNHMEYYMQDNMNLLMFYGMFAVIGLAVSLICGVITTVMTIVTASSKTGKYSESIGVNVFYVLFNTVFCLGMVVVMVFGMQSANLVLDSVITGEQNRTTVYDLGKYYDETAEEAPATMIGNVLFDPVDMQEINSSIFGDTSEIEQAFEEYGTLDKLYCYSNGTDFIVAITGESQYVNSLTNKSVVNGGGYIEKEYGNAGGVGYVVDTSDENDYQQILVPDGNSDDFVAFIASPQLDMSTYIVEIQSNTE